MKDKKTLRVLAIINVVVFGFIALLLVTDSSNRTAVSNFAHTAWGWVSLGTGMLLLLFVGMVLAIRNSSKDGEEDDDLIFDPIYSSLSYNIFNDDDDIDSTRGMDMDPLYNFTHFGYSDDK